MMRYISRSEAETIKIAEDIARTLKAGDVVALHGELGAGKTAFVKGIAGFFGAKDVVSSPTFTIVNEYNGSLDIYHFDAYRLENVTVDECDWIDDYLFGDGVCVIEWAENIKSILPEEHIQIKISKNPDEGAEYREIEVC